MNEYNFDLANIVEEVQQLAKDARKDTLDIIEQEAKIPEILNAFKKVCAKSI